MKTFQTKHGTQLIQELLASPNPIALTTLRSHLHLSRRSFYYTLKQVNQELAASGLDEIENIRNVGYQLPENSRQSLNRLFQQQKKASSFQQLFSRYYYFPQLSQKKRQLLIIFGLISRPTTSLNQLAAYFSVSKNTILADLRHIQERLQSTHSPLTIQNTAIGKQVVGDERIKRRWVFANFEQLMDLIAPQVNFNSNKYYYQQLQLLEKITGNAFTDNSVHLLVNYFGWQFERLQNLPDAVLAANLEQSDKFSLTLTWAKSFLADLHLGTNNKGEAPFLAKIVNSQAYQHINWQNPMIKQIKQVASEVIRSFNNVAGVHLASQNGRLVNDLTVHLVPTYYRLQFDIPYHNPLLRQIKHGHQETFELTRAAVKPFEKFAHAKLSDDELGLVTVYFSGAPHARSVNPKQKAGAMVVCSSGIGTSELLITQLRSHYPSVNFIGPFNTFEYENASLDNIRLVLSTINLPKLNDNCSVVTVPVIPGPGDWQLIDSQLLQAQLIQTPLNQKINVTTLMDIIANYARIIEPQKLEAALHDYLNKQLISPDTPLTPKVSSNVAISYYQQPVNWQEAIRISMDKLVSDGTVQPTYSDRIIELTQQHGAYMAIGKGVFLAHAAPRAGVNKLGFAYTFFAHPFHVSPDKKINFVVALAPIDQKKHLATLSQLLTCLQDETWLNRLQHVQSTFQLRRLLIEGGLYKSARTDHP